MVLPVLVATYLLACFAAPAVATGDASGLDMAVNLRIFSTDDCTGAIRAEINQTYVSFDYMNFGTTMGTTDGTQACHMETASHGDGMRQSRLYCDGDMVISEQYGCASNDCESCDSFLGKASYTPSEYNAMMAGECYSYEWVSGQGADQGTPQRPQAQIMFAGTILFSSTTPCANSTNETGGEIVLDGTGPPCGYQSIVDKCKRGEGGDDWGCTNDYEETSLCRACDEEVARLENNANELRNKLAQYEGSYNSPSPSYYGGGYSPSPSYYNSPSPSYYNSPSPSYYGGSYYSPSPSYYGGGYNSPSPSNYGGGYNSPSPSYYGGGYYSPSPSYYSSPSPSYYGGGYNSPSPSYYGGGYYSPSPSYYGGGYNSPSPSYYGGGYNSPSPSYYGGGYTGGYNSPSPSNYGGGY